MARSPVRLAFVGLWLVVWLAAMIVALAALAGAVRAGSYGAVPILLIWLAGAGFGLWRVGSRFAEGLAGERIGPERRSALPRHRWRDGLPGTGQARDGSTRR